jgi:hypothetical protein
LLQAKALQRLGKSELAITCCHRGLSSPQIYSDIILVAELKSLLLNSEPVELSKNQQTTLSLCCPVTATEQKLTTDIGTRQNSTETADLENDRERRSQKSRLQTLLRLLLKEDNDISDMRITTDILKSARSNLTHASGEDVVDDLIAYGEKRAL